MSDSRLPHFVRTFALIFTCLGTAAMQSQVEWSRQGDGPVLTGEALGPNLLELGEPGVLGEAGQFTLWFQVAMVGNPEAVMVSASSEDGIHWQLNDELILLPQRSAWRPEIYAPRVFFHQGEYRMWYSSHGASGCVIGQASSPDGRRWTQLGTNPIVSPSQPWELQCTDAPSVVFDGEVYHLWYTGAAGDSSSWESIGHAISTDGLTWAKTAGNPVLREGTSQLHAEIAIPCALHDPRTKSFEIWYTVFELPDESVVDLGYATSMDGIAWAKYPGNPVLSPESWDTAIVSPAVLFDGNEYHMWYKGDYRNQSFSYAKAPWSIPKASFSATPEAAFDGELVSFDASLSISPNGDVTSFRWNFGDGETGEGLKVSHAYAKPGHFAVTLTVADSAGREGSVARAVDVGLSPGDVAPWVSTDVGEHASPSAVRSEGEARCLRLFTSGGEVGLNADTFHFVERELDGDFTISLQIGSIDASLTRAKIGLMVRDGLEVGARHASILASQLSNGILGLVSRGAVGGVTRTKSKAAEEPVPGTWLRLERRDSTVTAFFSANGETWQQVSDGVRFDPPLPPRVLAGVAASGGRSGFEGGYQDFAATVCGLDVLQGIGPFLRGDCDGDGSVEGKVTDAIFLLAHNFTGGAAPPCLAACDSNADSAADISDAIHILSFNFLGGPAPPLPFPACGRSEAPGDIALGCAMPFQPCP